MITWTGAHQAPLSMEIHSPGKNTGVSCHFLLQGIFPTQGSNPGLLHCRQILYRLSHQGSPPSPSRGMQPTPRPQVLAVFSSRNEICLGKMLRVISGEGNGNPLQYSCLENPRGGGAWCFQKYLEKGVTTHFLGAGKGYWMMMMMNDNNNTNLFTTDKYHSHTESHMLLHSLIKVNTINLTMKMRTPKP